MIVGLITKQPLIALLALLWLPASLLLLYAFKKRLARVSAVCHISTGICLAIFSVVALSIYSLYGSLSVESVRAFVEGIRVYVVSEMQAIFADVVAELAIDVSGYIEMAVTMVLYVTPALIITIANVCAYIMHTSLLCVCYPKEEDQKEVLPLLSLDMSLASGVVYLLSAIALIVSVLLAEESALIIAAVCGNLVIILCPGLILTTLAAIKALNSKDNRSCFGTMLYFGVLFMICSLSIPVIFICATVGAIIIILSHVARARAQQN